MAIREIIDYNNKLIREKSEEVLKLDNEVKDLIEDMDDTLNASGGVGIAAVQIGVKKRIVLVKNNDKRYLVINPKIINSFGEEEDYEGCLSVKKEDYELILGKVKRPFAVEVEGLDENFNKVDIMAVGLTARAFSHEIDHLDGILYTDKMEGEFLEMKTKEEREEWKEKRREHKKGKVLLGMSGGVDSSVSAVLLKEAGYEVIGATMKLWEDKENPEIEGGCCSFSATNDAKRVCDKIEVPHYTLNCEAEFQKYVIDDFVNCYKNCKTPNPCIECNKYLKFGTFYKKALELGCDYISTGHYAKIEYSEKYNQYVMKKSESTKKDQTYFLYSIPKEVLPKMIFPLENFTDKADVRKIAEEYELNVAHKKDSQEVCFIPDNDYGNFLEKNLDRLPSKGNIVLKDGTILGKHKGLIYYTVGQRKGLGVSYKEPLYVVKLDKNKNEVIVGTEQDLYTNELYANELNFLLDIDLTKKIEVMAKVRYRAKEAKAILEVQENGLAKVTFEEPQRAITPGQSVVFYIDDVVLGGGKII